MKTRFISRPRLCAIKESAPAYAAKRIFLRKVGGGYIFIHRMSMEYFVALETEPSARSSE
jgi:hypothetical protein